ncbi:MAG: PQQ-dependent sugar dehydrogenase, partial [Rhizobiaceae bacterium]
QSFRLLASAAVLTAIATAASAEDRTVGTELVGVRATIVADGLENPWGLDFLPGGRAIVTERAGALRIVAKDGTLSEPATGLPDVRASGQGGLLDVIAAPDFETSHTIFFTFSQPGEGGAGTAVARATLSGTDAAPALDNVEVLFSMQRKTTRGQHFGSRLVFGPDGTLFVTTGDRGERDRAQDMSDSAGAVLRINQDGSVPADNPAPDGGDRLAQLWSKGHRNVQGADYDPLTGGLLVVEHGAQGGDEVNLAEAGKNYGWPVISYGVDYSGAKIGLGQQAEGYEQPLHYWDPSIAPSGLAVYDGEMFPEWKGDLLVGALKFGLLSRLDRDGQGKILGEERMLDGEFGRIRDVNVAPDGSIWLLTDEADGAIVRLSRAS